MVWQIVLDQDAEPFHMPGSNKIRVGMDGAPTEKGKCNLVDFFTTSPTQSQYVSLGSVLFDVVTTLC